MRSKQLAAIGAAALVAGAAALWLGRAPDPQPRPERESAAETASDRRDRTRDRTRDRATETAAASATAAAADTATVSAGLPRSLQGTDVDGDLRVDERGNLILGPEVIRLFNYFLSASGEEPDAVLKARVLAAIRERVGEPARGQAEALLEKYLGLREASRDLKDDLGREAEPSARLEVIRRLRREHFSEDEAAALFGEEEQESAVAAAKSEVMRDTSLSDEERQKKLAELDKELPEAARKAREEARLPQQQQAEEEAMRAAGATEEEIQRHRVATVGPEAAERLKGLDQQRADWNQRLEAFRAERAKLAGGTSDADARRLAEIRLLERSFSPTEQVRVKALLKIRGEPLDW